MEFTITASNGDSVKIEAQNWMAAMGKALPFFKIDLHQIGKMVCVPGADGSVFVEGENHIKTWIIREVARRITIVAAASSSNLANDDEPAADDEPSEVHDPVQLGQTPPPSLLMSITSSLHKDAEEVESLAERLFDLSFELSEAEPDEACQMALDLILEFVSAEAASVARGTLNDPSLAFVAATGPVADQIIGRTVLFGEGLIGMCFDMGGTLIVNDVETDSRHLDHLDQSTGFTTLAALCVPITDADGLSHGAIQLLNPPGLNFTPEHVETVETIAMTLAAALARHNS